MSASARAFMRPSKAAMTYSVQHHEIEARQSGRPARGKKETASPRRLTFDESTPVYVGMASFNCYGCLKYTHSLALDQVQLK